MKFLRYRQRPLQMDGFHHLADNPIHPHLLDTPQTGLFRLLEVNLRLFLTFYDISLKTMNFW